MKISLSGVLLVLLCSTTRAQRGVTRVCGLQVVIDPLLWAHVRDTVVADNKLPEDISEIERVARFRLNSLVSRLVNTANKVLDRYYFNNTKYKLGLQNIQILQEKECNHKGIYLCDPDLSLSSLLDSYSYINHDPFCLSYLLTFRNFPGGSLGLAWTATDSSGGVCDKHRLHTEIPLPNYEVTVNKSLNTGVVSLSRNFLPVSERVAALTFSHEIGHSFGAPHDTDMACLGGGGQGNYLMYPSGSLGLLPNNMQLSACSTSNMTKILHSRGGCWTVDTGRGVCGNSVVEGWEQCDCGDNVDQCKSSCCVPKNDPDGRQPCTLTTKAECSPSEGLCCNSTCQFIPSSVQCSTRKECSQGSFCHGARAICPAPANVDDHTPCHGGSKTCVSGQCSGSICQSLGMLPCQATTMTDTSAACSPHCKSPGIGCSPVAGVSFPAATECEVGGGFGHCSSRGSCEVGGEDGGPVWLVGVVLFLVFYLIICMAGVWVYCKYCRGGKITGEKVEKVINNREEMALSASHSDMS